MLITPFNPSEKGQELGKRLMSFLRGKKKITWEERIYGMEVEEINILPTEEIKVFVVYDKDVTNDLIGALTIDDYTSEAVDKILLKDNIPVHLVSFKAHNIQFVILYVKERYNKRFKGAGLIMLVDEIMEYIDDETLKKEDIAASLADRLFTV